MSAHACYMVLIISGLALCYVARYHFKYNNKHDKHGNLIVRKAPCGVCGEDIFTVIDSKYLKGNDHVAIKNIDSENNDAPMCDVGWSKDPGCFQSYHEKCFDLHECPVHPKKVSG